MSTTPTPEVITDGFGFLIRKKVTYLQKEAEKLQILPYFWNLKTIEDFSMSKVAPKGIRIRYYSFQNNGKFRSISLVHFIKNKTSLFSPFFPSY